jgi:uncharacterized protein (DUF58 family)
MASFKYLDPQDVRRLKNYEFGVKAMVEGNLSGRHRSQQRGASSEFHEFRQYADGDEMSKVDWRVYARTDKLFLRTFEQETNLECHLMLDCSASMGFASPEASQNKLEYASFFAAALAWWVISKNDRVSLTLFDQGIRKFLPPGTTRRHLHDILHTLEHNQPGSGTSLTEMLARAHPLLKRKGMLVLISDFFCDPAELFRALNPYLHRGFRVQLFHILDPGEWQLSHEGLTRFVDMETQEPLTVHAPSIKEAWHAQMLAHTRALRSLAMSRHADYALITTDEPYFSLFDHLRSR